MGGKWYHFSVSGRMETGHLYKGNNTYYLNPSKGEMVKDWYYHGYYRSYYNASGIRVEGWHCIDRKWYEFNSSDRLI
ncbi:hypothetical protein [Bacillus pseudomycoides]|uniref:hypothetical protein n=1 Tax=Bacillus pseudomycoides TaxID=64104 RepID=UPI0037BF3936